MANWKTTREAIAADYRRLSAFYASFGDAPDRPSRTRMGFIAVLLHRVAHQLYIWNWRRTARFVWALNICLTGAEIDPRTLIGPGFVIPYPRSVAVFGQIGANCTFMDHAGTGGTFQGIRGLPTLGDNVLVMSGSLILGPTIIGRDVVIGPRCIVSKNVPDGGSVSALAWPVGTRAPT